MKLHVARAALPSARRFEMRSNLWFFQSKVWEYELVPIVYYF